MLLQYVLLKYVLYLDENMSTLKSHEIANKLEKEIINNIDEICLALIHVDPIKIEK